MHSPCCLVGSDGRRAGTSTSPVGDQIRVGSGAFQSADTEGVDSSISQQGPPQTSLLPIGALLPSLDQPLVSPPGSHPRSIHQCVPEASLGHSTVCTEQTEIEDHEKDGPMNAGAFNECLDGQKSQDVVPFYVGKLPTYAT